MGRGARRNMAPSAVTFADHRGIPASHAAVTLSEHATTQPRSEDPYCATEPDPPSPLPSAWPWPGRCWPPPGRRGQPAQGRHHRRAHRRPDRQLPPDRQRDRRRDGRRRRGQGIAARDLESGAQRGGRRQRGRLPRPRQRLAEPLQQQRVADRHNGWGLNRTTGRRLGRLVDQDGLLRREGAAGHAHCRRRAAQWDYCGGKTNTDGIAPAANWVMIYNKACYAPGAGEGWDVKATESVAFQRVRNSATRP